MFCKMCYIQNCSDRDNNKESYIRLTDNEFKTRYNQHKSSFKLVHRNKDTKLSEHIWELKDRNIGHIIQWEIIKKDKPYTPEKKRVQSFFGRKISNFNQSSLPKQKKRDFLSLRVPKTFLAVKCKHKPPAIIHSYLKRAARARNSGVMANQNLN